MTQASVITYSRKPTINIKLSQGNNRFNIERDLDGLLGATGGPRVDIALALAKDEAFSTESGGRSDVSKLVVLLTDGLMAEADNAVAVTEQLRNEGIALFVIGVGRLSGSDMMALDKLMAGQSVPSRPAPVVPLDGLTGNRLVRQMYIAAGDVGMCASFLPSFRLLNC